MEPKMNENINLESENMDRETQTSEGDMMDDELYEEGMMMPYDMQFGYGHGIMPYGTQQSPGQDTMPYGSYQMPGQGVMPYESEYMPYDTMQSYPMMHEGMYPQTQSTQPMYRQGDLLPLLLLGLATGYSPYYPTYYPPYYPTYYPPYYPTYYPPYYPSYYGGYHHHRIDE